MARDVDWDEVLELPGLKFDVPEVDESESVLPAPKRAEGVELRLVCSGGRCDGARLLTIVLWVVLCTAVEDELELKIGGRLEPVDTSVEVVLRYFRTGPADADCAAKISRRVLRTDSMVVFGSGTRWRREEDEGILLLHA